MYDDDGNYADAEAEFVLTINPYLMWDGLNSGNTELTETIDGFDSWDLSQIGELKTSDGDTLLTVEYKLIKIEFDAETITIGVDSLSLFESEFDGFNFVTGILSGIPLQDKIYKFTVVISDASGKYVDSEEKVFILTIEP